MTRTHIPVMDTPVRPAKQVATLGSLAKRTPDIFYPSLLVLTVSVFVQLFIEMGPLAFRLGVLARYVLWLSIVAGVFFHVGQRGVTGITRGLLPVIPFFLLGIFSSLFSVQPFDAAQVLIFWILGMLAAVVIGTELEADDLVSTLFFTFSFVIIGSIAAALLMPEFGTQFDSRALGGSGAWRGLVPNKNGLGYLTAFAFVFVALASRRHWMVRCTIIVLTLICSVLSNSQGGLLTAAAAVAYLIIVHVLYSVRGSATLRATLLLLIIVSAALLIKVSIGYLLELSGRDASFTGRSMIWPAYFTRALDHWLIGAGPGTFTRDSSVTADVGASFMKYGNIHTPHNMYIAVFGEIGLLGLLAFCGALVYFVFYAPFVSDRKLGLGVGACSFTLMIGGLSETREVFGQGISMFLILTLYSAACKKNIMLRRWHNSHHVTAGSPAIAVLA